MKTHTENIIYNKTFDFSLKIIKLYKKLVTENNEYIISKQLLRSGTSIGANISESIYAVSKKEFIYKLQISLKEACETRYWLDLLSASSLLQESDVKTLTIDIIEIIKILTSIINSSKDNLSSYNYL